MVLCSIVRMITSRQRIFIQTAKALTLRDK
jgi:hypothetical protein